MRPPKVTEKVHLSPLPSPLNFPSGLFDECQRQWQPCNKLRSRTNVYTYIAWRQGTDGYPSIFDKLPFIFLCILMPPFQCHIHVGMYVCKLCEYFIEWPGATANFEASRRKCAQWTQLTCHACVIARRRHPRAFAGTSNAIFEFNRMKNIKSSPFKSLDESTVCLSRQEEDGENRLWNNSLDR